MSLDYQATFRGYVYTYSKDLRALLKVCDYKTVIIKSFIAGTPSQLPLTQSHVNMWMLLQSVVGSSITPG